MYRHDPQHLEFVSHFVDSVTVRPFFEDLRRVKQVAAMLGQLPRVSRPETNSTAAA